jgi:hypothetical protein
MSMAMMGVAYIVPTLITPDIISGFNTNIIELYRTILMTGSIFYLLGMFIGNKLEYHKKSRFLWEIIPENRYCEKVARLTVILTLFAVCGLIICFIGMGHIPLFSEDPIAARFHKGVYRIPFRRVSKLFRICQCILQFTSPLLVVLWFHYRKQLYAILLIFSLVVMTFCASRGPAFSGLVIGFGIISAYRKSLFKYYLFFLPVIYGVGSSFFYILGITSFGSGTDVNIFEIMIQGAPDVFEHLFFLTAFSEHPHYTYGRTFVGGLIPNDYYWNPGVWSLHIIDGGNIQDAVSGGLRLPVPIWGYASFSWIGVVFVSFLSGFLTGIFVKKTKIILCKTDNIIIKTIIIILYMKLYSFFINFHTMRLHEVPIFLLVAVYLYNFRISRRNSLSISLYQRH